MLDRIALHQTRLRTPGLGLDAKGVALGSKGLVLLPSLDRLVAFLSVYTREHALDDLMPSLTIHFVRSKLGTREITVEFAAESSDRMDRMAETARLVGGFAFTGTSRHFVQYRDAAAPFGYDATELLSNEAGIVVYHEKFSQGYEPEKAIDVRALLLRLMPHENPSTLRDAGSRFIVAEQGLGPALIHYFVRSRVDGDVCVAEWPPSSSFDDSPILRYVFRIPELPPRMHALLTQTPGITNFLPDGQGVAVQIGFSHPIALRACPVFRPDGLVLFRGRGEDPWIIDKLPQMGDLRAFARVELRSETEGVPMAPTTLRVSAPSAISIALRVVPSSAPWRNVTASWLTPAEVVLLRKLAYALPRQAIAAARLAVTPQGVFLRAANGIEAIPLGTFYTEVHTGLFVPAGFEFSPSIAPETIQRSLGAPSGTMVFFGVDSRAFAIEESSFSSLETMLLESSPWEPLVAEAITSALEEKPIELRIDSVGVFPMSGAKPPEPTPDAP